MELKGKVALVTGAARRVGRTIATHFAERGAAVAVHYNRSRAEAESFAAEIERAGGKGAKAFIADVSNSAAVKKMFADFIAAYGTIDILINNAGIGRIREDDTVAAGTADLSDDDWHKMLSTHLDSTFFCTREALWKCGLPGGSAAPSRGRGR